MSAIRSALLALALVALAASPALADVVRLRDGTVLEGRVFERGKDLVIEVRKGVELVLDRSQVVSIERTTAPREEYERRRAQLVPGDAEVRFELAEWCKRAGLTAERREVLEEVVKLDPDHAAARQDLGFVRDGERWVPEAELRRKLGFERWQGKWIPVEEAKRLRRTDELRKLLLQASFRLRKPDQLAAARAELGALKDPPELLAPLLEERLDDHDPSVRRTFVELLGSTRHAAAAPTLLKRALTDDDALVRESAARGLWATGEAKARTELVQSLFANARERRERAAEALGTIAEPETVPYLIEALEVAVLRSASELEDGGSVVRDDPSSPAAPGLHGRFGPWNEPRTTVSWGRTRDGQVLAAVRQRPVLVALTKLTGRDFSYSKPDWIAWWKAEGKAKLGAKPGAPR